ncbi:MAG TPA: glycoside hydrolase family 88 protein [Puia sp.]|nr:glycoside hydrolase family 88 protein [Puia sp.]
MHKRFLLLLAGRWLLWSTALAQTKPAVANDVTSPLHALRPDYPVPYGIPAHDTIKATLDRVLLYLDAVTPPRWVDRVSGTIVDVRDKADTTIGFQQGDFRLTSYEWGVTYAGMLLVGEVTGDHRFTQYTQRRLEWMAAAAPAFRALYQRSPARSNPLRQMIDPHALDDAGAMCAAMIKTLRGGGSTVLRPVIDHYIGYISHKEYRLRDGTLARNRPQKNTLWLDDLFMSVPALAQMGKLTGDRKYYDDAVRQVLQFSQRMFDRQLHIYMHGWVEGMTVHPQFHWARANGWALMAMTELLDVLPADHPGREAVLRLLRDHVAGLAAYQSGNGLWHQLLDRDDSYLETSATAIYTYCIARAINRGWIDARAYGPMCLLGWDAVATRVNALGQVEGTCVGTGMAFDPAFYYYRPTNVYAAHGYGPVLLAGAEVMRLLETHSFGMNDSSIQLDQ